MKILLRLATLAMLACSPGLHASPLAVRVEQGALAGVDRQGVSAFLGVPYAAPPVGPNRWRAPQPAARWTGVRQAKAFSANCMQDDGSTARNMPPWTPEYMIQGPVSEDCLYLNVWTPARSASAKLPVLVWIHGGAFRSGGGDVPVYEGRNLASRGIIVVSINYRLGIYGFLAHPLLTAEAGTSGNYGLRDQVAALAWVKRNIRAFGGDPSRVTVAGQSAGAASVHDLILSPLAKGLFVRAIAQSGSGMGFPMPARAAAEATGTRIARAAKAETLEAMRALTPQQFLQAERQGGPASSPIADGVVLPADPSASSAYNDTPILTGLVADEGSAFGMRARSADAFRNDILRRYGSFAERFLAAYPAEDAVQSSSALGRDRAVASMLLWARERRKTTRYPIYAYLFSHVEPGPDSAKFGAFHSSEIPYVFGTLDTAPQRNFADTDRAVSERLQAYWVNFVRSGNPNARVMPAWPRLDDQQRLMAFGEEATARAALAPDRLRLFAEYVAGGGRLGLF